LGMQHWDGENEREEQDGYEIEFHFHFHEHHICLRCEPFVTAVTRQCNKAGGVCYEQRSAVMKNSSSVAETEGRRNCSLLQ
jgi:hypothetical protein